MKAKQPKNRGLSHTPTGDEAPLRFAGNNYLALAASPLLTAAATEALSRYGVNVSASRLSTGTAEIHVTLEKALAQFMGREGALVFASGYLGNLILLQALTTKHAKHANDAYRYGSISAMTAPASACGGNCRPRVDFSGKLPCGCWWRGHAVGRLGCLSL